MSKVAIQGNASGTGTFTIAAPDSDENRTLTLPDEAGTVLTTATTASSIPGYGNQITIIDTYRVSADVSLGSGGVVNNNWERPDSDGHYVGSGVTEAAGVFSFSETGLYLVIYNFFLYITSAAGNTRNIQLLLESTENNSSYSTLSYSNISKWNHSDNTHAQHNGHAVFDVTNITNYKLRFNTVFGNGNGAVGGNTLDSRSYVTFMKLGDT